MTPASADFFRSKRWRRLELGLLLAILLLAAFLRIWRLEQMPPGLYHDEAYNGLDALSLLAGKSFPQFYEGWELYAQDAHAGNPPEPTRFPVFFEGNYGREPLHIYLMALSIKLLGAAPFAIRIVPALAGVLAVLATFLAAKVVLEVEDQSLKIGDGRLAQSFGKLRTGSLIFNLSPLFAAFTLAILFPAIHFSRFGLRAMLFVPVETLAVYFFWRGVNRGVASGRASFIVAGFMLGLGLYVYAAGRLLPLLFLLFVPIWFWREREALRREWVNVGLMAGVSLLTAVPILLFFARYPYFFIFRIGYVANKGTGVVEGKPWLTWLLNVGRVIGGFFWQGETHLRHNLPGRPYLDLIQAFFFLTGLVYALRQRLNLRTVFLFLWLAVMLLPSIMSGDAPHFGRLTGAAPVVAIFVGLGAAWLLSLFTVHWTLFTENRVARMLLAAGAVLLFAASLFLSVRDYFGRYASHPQLEADFYLPDWELGQMAAAQREGTQLYLTPTQEEMATIYFALADPERMRSYSGAGGAIPAGVPGLPSLYFVRPEDAASLQNLQSWFPDGRTGDPQNGFIPFSVSENAERLPYLLPEVPAFGDEVRLLYWSADEENGQLRVTLAWQAAAPMSVNYTAFVHLLGEDGPPLAQTDRPPGGYPTSDWQRGEIVVDTFVVELPPDLPPGTYTLQTGFYDLATLERLGTAVLGEIMLNNE